VVESPVQGLDWLPSLRTTKREEDEAPEEDEEVQDLRTELKQAQTVKERFKSAALKIRKENAELRDVNMVMQSYPVRALGRRLQVDWARDPRVGPRVLMSLRVDFEPMG